MEPKAATLAVLAALGIGAVSYSVGAYHIKDDVAKPSLAVTATDAEIKTAVGPVLLTKFTESQASGVVVCRKGVVSNMPPSTVYCSDGLKAGFVLPAATADALLGDESEVKVFVDSGKAYVMGAVPK